MCMGDSASWPAYAAFHMWTSSCDGAKCTVPFRNLNDCQSATMRPFEDSLNIQLIDIDKLCPCTTEALAFLSSNNTVLAAIDKVRFPLLAHGCFGDGSPPPVLQSEALGITTLARASAARLTQAAATFALGCWAA